MGLFKAFEKLLVNKILLSPIRENIRCPPKPYLGYMSGNIAFYLPIEAWGLLRA